MSENEMKRCSKKKFSLEERKNYYLAWKETKLNTTNFCKTHRISKSALYSWTKEFEKENDDSGFSPIIIDKKLPAASTNTIQLTIGFKNTAMEINIEIAEHQLVSFIQEIGYAAAIIR